MIEREPSEQSSCMGEGTCDRCVQTHSEITMTDHHLFYPRNEYTTPLERRFRNHPDNRVSLPWCEHKARHALEKPPTKPSIQKMSAFLVKRDIKLDI